MQNEITQFQKENASVTHLWDMSKRLKFIKSEGGLVLIKGLGGVGRVDSHETAGAGEAACRPATQQPPAMCAPAPSYLKIW